MATREKVLGPNQLFSVIEVVGRVTKVELSKDFKNGMDQDMLQLRVKWISSEIFVWEKELSMIKTMNKVQVDDVIKIKGLFHCRWNPKTPKTYPTIEKVLEFQKLGIFKK